MTVSVSDVNVDVDKTEGEEEEEDDEEDDDDCDDDDIFVNHEEAPRTLSSVLSIKFKVLCALLISSNSFARNDNDILLVDVNDDDKEDKEEVVICTLAVSNAEEGVDVTVGLDLNVLAKSLWRFSSSSFSTFANSSSE